MHNIGKAQDEVVEGVKKKISLKLFAVPLILIVLVQALIAGVPVLFGTSNTMLTNYSVGILGQTVTTRKIIIENNMVQNWSNVSELVDAVNMQLGGMLKQENMQMEQFLQDDVLQRDLLWETLESCLISMRKNVVTGCFIVLGSPYGEGEHRLNGMYFRDTDPYTNSANYTDVLMERGDSTFSMQMNIPFDICWKSSFHFENPGVREADNFFYKPLEAAKEHPGVNYTDLGYWSKPFCLEGNIEKDAHQMITYSVPLIYEDGTVYGVAGMEISLRHLMEMLPSQEISEEEYDGYLMALYQQDGSLYPIAFTGTAPSRIAAWNEELHLEKTGYDDLYYIGETRGSGEELMASVKELHLYNSNTPFEEEKWVIMGIRNHEALFGFGRAIVINYSISLMIALLVALTAITIALRRLTKPIMSLSESIREEDGRKLEGFKGTNIREIDELYQVVRHLSQVQMENEYRLTEEKERYKVALQSSTDVLFTCDCQNNTMELVNMNKEKGILGEIYIDDIDTWIRESDMVHQDSRAKAYELFHSKDSEIQGEILARLTPDVPFEWTLIKGKTIYDASGKPSKLIGSTQDISQRKEAENREQSRKKIDQVTTLYKLSVGRAMIEERLLQGGTGCLALLDIDDFFQLNETYGIIVGDTILEEIGILVRAKLKDLAKQDGLWTVGIRAGGDEILMWIEGMSSHQVKEAADILRQDIGELYESSTLSLSVSLGISERMPIETENSLKESPSEVFESLLRGAKQALAFAKAEGDAKIVAFRDLTEEQKQRFADTSINEIASMNHESKLSIVSLVFNFFDKGGKMENILPILLTKLGRTFRAVGILMTTADMDFRSTYTNYWWEDRAGVLPDDRVTHFDDTEFQACLQDIENEARKVVKLEELEELGGRFLMVYPGSRGVSVSLYDGELYMGSLTFVCDEGREEWTEDEINDIQEIGKIIENNYSKELHDMASRAKSEFLSRMSHEMRTPMNAIMGMTAIAQTQKEEPEKIKESLDKIQQSSEYLLNLINDVLDMSKIESGKMKLVSDSFPLQQTLDNICQMIRTQVDEKELQFETNISINCNWVKGDMLHLQQVLVNLLSNAIKFTPRYGKVTLSVRQKMCREDAVEVWFSVKDTGIGISEENRIRIFHSFEQADENVSRQYGGTGLGLAISGHLVNMMGGVIELESQPGKGSDFSFRLIMEVGEESMENSSVEEINLTGKRILLVDDNELNVEIAQTLLEMRGLEVETASDGKEAVEKYEGKKSFYYDLILMDIRMPVMNGLEAARAIRNLEKEDARLIPIVAMTANAFDEDMKKSIESGMNGHLSKPIDVKVMMEMINKVIKR